MMNYNTRVLNLFRRLDPEERQSILAFALFLRSHRQFPEREEAPPSGRVPAPEQPPEVPAPVPEVPAPGADSR